MLTSFRFRPAMFFEGDGGGGGGKPPGGDGGKPGGEGGKPDGEGDKPPEFDAWMAAQPEPVRKMLDAHEHGLKSALQKERDDRKKEKDAVDLAEANRKKTEMTEIDRLKAEKKEADDKVLAADLRAKNVLISTTIRVAASQGRWGEKKAQAFADPADAERFIDAAKREALKIEGDNVAGVDDLLTALAKDKPYLLTAVAPPKNKPNLDGDGGPDGKRTDEEEAAIKRRFGI